MNTGDNLFTFLSIGNAVDRAFSIYLSRWFLFSQLALVVAILQIIMTTTLGKDMFWGTPAVDEGATIFANMSPQLFFPVAMDIPLSFLSGIIIQAAIIQIVAEYYTQKQSTFRGSLTAAFSRVCAIFGFAFVAIMTLSSGNEALQFLATLVMIAATAFFIYAMLSLTIVLPILVIEKQSPIGAVKRSFDLLQSYRCYVFCSMFLLAVVAIFGTMIYQGVVRAIFGTSILGSIVSGLSAVVTLPLQTIIAAVLYFSVRVQQEGLNMETLLTEMETGSHCDKDGSGNYKNVLLAEVDSEVV